MTEDVLSDADLAALRQFDTPTICNGLELVVPERRAKGFTTEPFFCADSTLAPMVGYARTATIRALEPSALDAEALRAQRGEYYAYVGGGPGPTVSVIQDLDPNPGFGAFWGEVNTTIHRGLGCLGAVTNGSFRDRDDLAPEFQILGGKVGPSHAHVHLVGIGGRVNIFGMTVDDGDLIHADRHGAVVIPKAAARELPAAVDLVVRREKVILDACKEPDFDAERLRQAMAESAKVQ